MVPSSRLAASLITTPPPSAVAVPPSKRPVSRSLSVATPSGLMVRTPSPCQTLCFLLPWRARWRQANVRTVESSSLRARSLELWMTCLLAGGGDDGPATADGLTGSRPVGCGNLNELLDGAVGVGRGLGGAVAFAAATKGVRASGSRRDSLRTRCAGVGGEERDAGQVDLLVERLVDLPGLPSALVPPQGQEEQAPRSLCRQP